MATSECVRRPDWRQTGKRGSPTFLRPHPGRAATLPSGILLPHFHPPNGGIVGHGPVQIAVQIAAIRAFATNSRFWGALCDPDLQAREERAARCEQERAIRSLRSFVWIAVRSGMCHDGCRQPNDLFSALSAKLATSVQLNALGTAPQASKYAPSSAGVKSNTTGDTRFSFRGGSFPL